MNTYISKSDAQTRKIARKFAGELKSGDVVTLSGDLGYGKTIFSKGIAEGLGIEKRIISPTFTIIREHQIKSQKSKVKSTNKNSKVGTMYHIDLYRIENESQLEEVGVNEILGETNSIKIIEWPEKVKDIKAQWEIRFELGKQDHERKIEIKHNE